MRDHKNRSSVKQLSKIASTVHTLYRPSGGPCIYGTYVGLPVAKGLKIKPNVKRYTWKEETDFFFNLPQLK